MGDPGSAAPPSPPDAPPDAYVDLAWRPPPVALAALQRALGAGPARRAGLRDELRQRLVQEYRLWGYRVVFTAGALDGTAALLAGACRAFAARTKYLPHVVSVAPGPEERRLLEALQALRVCTHSEAPDWASVAALCRPHTCLVLLGERTAGGGLADLGALAVGAPPDGRRQVPVHADVSRRLARRPQFEALGLGSLAAGLGEVAGLPGGGFLAVHHSVEQAFGLHDDLNVLEWREAPPWCAAAGLALARRPDPPAPPAVRALRTRLLRELLRGGVPLQECPEGEEPRAPVGGGGAGGRLTPLPYASWAAAESDPLDLLLLVGKNRRAALEAALELRAGPAEALGEEAVRLPLLLLRAEQVPALAAALAAAWRAVHQ